MKRFLIKYICALACFSVFFTGQLALSASYKLSMLPRYSTEEINARISPLAEYLTNKTGLTITPLLTSTFDQYSKKLESGGIDIGYENPYIYVLSSKAHEVVAMAVKGRDEDKFRGLIIKPKNSPLKNLNDLKGKKISIVGLTSAGGYLSQRLTLLQNDIDVAKDCIIEEAPENKQENVVFSVYTGDVDAGFIRESALHKVDTFVPLGSIKILKRTAWFPNWALSISRRMPKEDRDKIIKALQEIEEGDRALTALKIDSFKLAKDEEYNSVRKAAGLSLPTVTD